MQKTNQQTVGAGDGDTPTDAIMCSNITLLSSEPPVLPSPRISLSDMCASCPVIPIHAQHYDVSSSYSINTSFIYIGRSWVTPIDWCRRSGGLPKRRRDRRFSAPSFFVSIYSFWNAKKRSTATLWSNRQTERSRLPKLVHSITLFVVWRRNYRFDYQFFRLSHRSFKLDALTDLCMESFYSRHRRERGIKLNQRSNFQSFPYAHQHDASLDASPLHLMEIIRVHSPRRYTNKKGNGLEKNVVLQLLFLSTLYFTMSKTCTGPNFVNPSSSPERSVGLKRFPSSGLFSSNVFFTWKDNTRP